jgi:hypothetical protein
MVNRLSVRRKHPRTMARAHKPRYRVVGHPSFLIVCGQQLRRPFRDVWEFSVKRARDGIARVKLHGACCGCAMSPMTMKAGVEVAIKRAAPDIRIIASSREALLSSRLEYFPQVTSAWEWQTRPKGEALRRILAEAAAYCGEEPEVAASQWRDLLEMCQFLYPMIDLPLF